MSRHLPAWRPTFSGLFDHRLAHAAGDGKGEASPRRDDGGYYAPLDTEEAPMRGVEALACGELRTFDYGFPEQPQEVVISMDGFTARCPWSGAPERGVLTIAYVPDARCVESQSLDRYLQSFRDVGIVQEHAAARILRDLAGLLQPHSLRVTLDYAPETPGGLRTVTTLEHCREADRAAALRSA